MSDAPFPICVAALYKFTPFDDCASIRRDLAQLCGAHGVKGTLLLAREGINGTIAGSDAAIEHVLAAIRALPGCADPGGEAVARRGPAVPPHEGADQARDRDDGAARH